MRFSSRQRLISDPLVFGTPLFLSLLGFGLLGGTGCASFKDAQSPPPVFEADFTAPPEKVWNITLREIQDLPIEKKDDQERILETAWMEGWSERPFGIFSGGALGGQWKRRMKLTFHFSSPRPETTHLRLVSRVEEKPPGGSQAFRWQRVPSEGKLEKEIFLRIQQELHPSP